MNDSIFGGVDFVRSISGSANAMQAPVLVCSQNVQKFGKVMLIFLCPGTPNADAFSSSKMLLDVIVR